MAGADGERLQRLLGGAGLAGLRLRLRARYERGAVRDEFTLSDLAAEERRALAGLLGRRTLAAGSMKIRRSELDQALARAGVARTLREALELLDGPLLDRRADRTARDEAWTAAFAAATEPRLAGLLADVAGAALVKRLAAGDPARAVGLLTQAGRVLARLPARGLSRAQLAAEALGDSHGLDAGRPVATVVLRACALPASSSEADALPGDPEESIRERWARLGVTVNELALPALCLNLPLRSGGYLAPSGGARPGLAPPGEPLHLSLRRLLRRPPDWSVAGCAVFVCENPNVVAIAADRLGAACAPLVCTDGMPAAAQQTLLAQLAAAGACLRYHGDFDWPGLAIGNFVMRQFGAAPWRFGAQEYLAAADHAETPQAASRRPVVSVIAHWDVRLAASMAERRVIVHEEGVVEELLIDLASRRVEQPEIP